MNRKLHKYFDDRFGTVPDVTYLAGDLDAVREYYDYRRDREPDAYVADGITWKDLGGDDLFVRINPGLTSSGEQYLYYMLRNPAQTAEEYGRRAALIDRMGANDKLRLKLQTLLYRLGRDRRADLCAVLTAEKSYWWILYAFLGLCLLAFTALTLFVSFNYWFAVLMMLAVNSLVHVWRMKRVERKFFTVNYFAVMVKTLRKIRKLRDTELDALFKDDYGCLRTLRFASMGVQTRPGRDGRIANAQFSIVDSLLSALLLDLLSYEFIKNAFARHRDATFKLNETVGRIDAAIAVASYRRSLGDYAVPELDFAAEKPFIDAENAVHPLLSNAEPNGVDITRGLLITGSNASGKSTYLKTAALCVILAQSICTVTADSYRASVLRVYTSMALTDNLFAGESYYVTEIKSLRRVFTAADAPGNPVFCVADEVLRGTNTVERVAAASSVLHALAVRGALCLAATHDIELCQLLREHYVMRHFSEDFADGEMTFDYVLRDGAATTRNAIRLLEIMGFDDEITAEASRRADAYLGGGVWE